MVSASDIWAVGTAGVILHYSETPFAHWSQIKSPTSDDLRDLYMLSPNDTTAGL